MALPPKRPAPRPKATLKPKRSFTDQVIARSGHLVHKLKAKDTSGRWAYYFVFVQPSKERLFLKAIEGEGDVDLSKYGKVIASCFGDGPSDEVKAFLKDKYGFDV